jgi:hypothetical protein
MDVPGCGRGGGRAKPDVKIFQGNKSKLKANKVSGFVLKRKLKRKRLPKRRMNELWLAERWNGTHIGNYLKGPKNENESRVAIP